jgi:hypothetical protein
VFVGLTSQKDFHLENEVVRKDTSARIQEALKQTERMRVRMKDGAATTAKKMIILIEKALKNPVRTRPVTKKMAHRTQRLYLPLKRIVTVVAERPERKVKKLVMKLASASLVSSPMTVL